MEKLKAFIRNIIQLMSYVITLHNCDQAVQNYNMNPHKLPSTAPSCYVMFNHTTIIMHSYTELLINMEDNLKGIWQLQSKRIIIMYSITHMHIM